MFDKPTTKTLEAFIAAEGPNGSGRVTGLSIEPDGVFIYTNSEEWCDDAGAGTFRGDSETAAIARFRTRVKRANATDTIDLAPTWTEAAQIIAAVLENGTELGRSMAREELYRMAEMLDQQNANAGKEPGQ